MFMMVDLGARTVHTWHSDEDSAAHSFVLASQEKRSCCDVLEIFVLKKRFGTGSQRR
jgi:hypothetical protein